MSALDTACDIKTAAINRADVVLDGAKPTAWVRTRQGRRIDILNPTVDMIHRDDVAIALARNPRYNGWLDGDIDDVYSIAQHSVYVARTMYNYGVSQVMPRSQAKRLGLIGLTHDAPEYVLGDFITPLKVLCLDYQKLEADWEPICYEWAGCPNPTDEEIKIMHWADRTVLLQEMVEFGRPIQWALDQGWNEPVAPLFVANPGHTVWRPSVSYQTFLDELEFLQKF